MKTKSKISGYILRRSAAALLFSGAIVALCSAIDLPSNHPKVPAPQDNAAFSANRHQNRSLSFADRVAYQRAIEDIFWRHRIWPRERPDSKPSLDVVMSQAQLEKKVTEYLRNSQALEDYRQRPIIAEQLQSEMERIASHTKQPEVLREIFAALGNDPFVIAECLARPVLAERLVTRLNAQGEKPTTIAWLNQPLRSWLAKAKTKVPMTMAAVSRVNYTLPVIASPSDGCSDDTWTPTSTTNAPSRGAASVWTGSEMIVWSDGTDSTGGRYNPTTDSWIATSTRHAPSPRSYYTMVWTGSEMIVWGGYDGNALNTGGRYNPSTDSWTATSLTNAPSARFQHSAVWTGSEMIVWAGLVGFYSNTGGRYNPSTDSWTATNITNAPAPRSYQTAVWSETASEMIVWGGVDGSTGLNTGGRYNPSTDSWTATSITGAPSARFGNAAVWTGSEMIVWGGNTYPGFVYLNTGGRYNPDTDSWTPTGTTDAPSPRNAPAVWTGSEMIVWGGDAFPTFFNTGGRYNPSTDSWTATSTTNAPSPRLAPAVWTGSEMIVWGGTDDSTGGRYCAAAPVPFTLSAVGHKVGGINTVRLTWSGATSTDVDVYRNGVVIVTTANDGRYIDSTGDTGQARYRYMVCEAGTQTCSNEVTVKFRQ